MPVVAFPLESVKPAAGSLGGLENALSYGADPTGLLDSSTAVQAAIDRVKANSFGGTVYLPSGVYLIKKTLNLSNINPQSFNYASNKAITFKGDGLYQTYLVGGEPGYGFIDMVGSNYITLTGLSIRSDVATQYGIILGRKTGDASSGSHIIKDISIYGSFIVSAIFSMSSEVNEYNRLYVYTTSGKGIVLARDTAGYKVNARHTQLSSTAIIAGGDGLNQMINVAIFTISPNPEDYPLTLEYVQRFYSRSLEIYSKAQTAQILLRKTGTGITFNGLHQEYGDVEPWGIYFSSAYSSPGLPQFRDIVISGSSVYGIYAENNVEIGGLSFNNSSFRGSKQNTVDLYNLYNSTINHDNNLISVTRDNLRPKYRIRNISELNSFGNVVPPNLDVYDANTNAINSGMNMAELYDLLLSFNKDTGVTGYSAVDKSSGVVSTLDPGNTIGGKDFAVYIDFTVVGGDSIIASVASEKSISNGSNAFVIYQLSGDLRITSLENANSSHIEGKSENFVRKYSGKRVRMLVARDASRGGSLSLYFNGVPVKIARIGTPVRRAWSDAITGKYFKLGYGNGQDPYKGVFFDAAIMNFFPSASHAANISRYGITAPYRWGTNAGSKKHGAILRLNFGAGKGPSVPDDSDYGQHATIMGDASWGVR
jgi:hypothetical protein